MSAVNEKAGKNFIFMMTQLSGKETLDILNAEQIAFAAPMILEDSGVVFLQWLFELGIVNRFPLPLVAQKVA